MVHKVQSGIVVEVVKGDLLIYIEAWSGQVATVIVFN
jgi:hypothetical protein